MAVAYLYESSLGGTQQYDDILNDLGDEPPEGLMLHVAGIAEAGKLRIVEVWESDAARDRFGERLFPVFARHGFDPAMAPQPIRIEVHNMIGIVSRA